MRDYINDTFIKLTKEGRIADAVTFCEKVAEEAPYTEFKCLALKNLAECHFFFTGDGEACRQANLRGLKLLEDNPELLEGTEHMSEKTVKRMYSDFCEQFRSLAVSFEEYEEYCEKPLKVRSRNTTEERGLKVTQDMKSRNVGWIENMFNLIENYMPMSDLQSGRMIRGAAQASCLTQLILTNRRKLRAKELDINFGMQQLQNAAVAAVDNIMDNCRKAGYTPDPGQYLFILEKARDSLESMRNERLADLYTIDVTTSTLGKLIDRLSSEVDKSSLDKQTADPAYLTMEKLDKDFSREMDDLAGVRLSDADYGSLNNEAAPDPFADWSEPAVTTDQSGFSGGSSNVNREPRVSVPKVIGIILHFAECVFLMIGVMAFAYPDGPATQFKRIVLIAVIIILAIMIWRMLWKIDRMKTTGHIFALVLLTPAALFVFTLLFSYLIPGISDTASGVVLLMLLILSAVL
ncbi:MAG: hypothetical protein IJJ31_02600 [Mogibacterium sp.]|nr:hypothetical protein [Mogibacterium sp.]